MKIYLVRHGETDWNKMRKWQGHTNIELNETGINQATALSQTIGEYSNISVIYASPLKRAYKMAEILNRSLNVDIIARDGLKEVKLGVWEGMGHDEVSEKYEIDFKNWNSRIDSLNNVLGVESLVNLQKRAFVELDNLRKQTSGDFLIVGHGAWIGSLLQELLGNTTEIGGLMHIENAKLIEIEYDDKTKKYIVKTELEYRLFHVEHR